MKALLARLALCAPLLALIPAPALAGPIQMPGGVDFARLNALEKEMGLSSGEAARKMADAQKTKIYIDLLGITKDTDSQLMFTRQKRLTEDAADRVRERFATAISQTDRFQVYNARQSQSGVEEGSTIYLHGRILSAHQDILDRLGVRKAVTTVTLRLAITDTKDGRELRSKLITGIYGDDAGEGESIPRDRKLDDPQVQNNLANSYVGALDWALEIAAAYIEKTYRPMGIVLATNEDAITVYGGSNHGIHEKDRFILFRLRPIPGVARRDIGEKIPLALVECAPDATTSTCRVIEKKDNAEIKQGDLAVLADTSLRLHAEGE